MSDHHAPPADTPASRALVIDDDEVIVEFLKAQLTKLGFAVTTAGDGMTALNLCREQAFDLVLCDVRMPRLSGINFIQNVRRIASASVGRIIMISSMDDNKVRRDALDAGASDFLVKPVSAAKLAEALAKGKS
jgi:DNA-binding response OmpR family regulator